jgi:hypothetical protein
MAPSLMAGKAVDTIQPMTGKGFSESKFTSCAQLRCHRAIIKLGTTGSIKGFDIDTSHFNGMATRDQKVNWLIRFSKGNEAPAASVQVLHIPEGEESPAADDARVRRSNSPVNETSLILFPVVASSPEVTLRPLRETLFPGTRNTAC